MLFCNKLELKYLCKKTISVNFWSAKESQSFILLSILSSLFKSTGLCKSEQDEETINSVVEMLNKNIDVPFVNEKTEAKYIRNYSKYTIS